jgi:general stress protein 26
MTSTHDDQTNLWSLIRDIKFGMFTHKHEDGMLHSAPLTTQNGQDDQASVLYFFVPRGGDIAHCITRDGNVNVSYSNPGDDSYVSISGAAAIVENTAKKEALFTSISKAWFPGGPTDPTLALLEVAIEHAEYWDVKESKMMQLAKMATAAITGKPPTDLGEHKHLTPH